MPSNQVFDTTFGGHPFTLRLNLAVTSQDIPTNTSTLAWNLQVIKTTANTPNRSDSAPTWSFNYDGSGHWGPYTFSGPVGQSLIIASGTFDAVHDADGTKTLSPSFAANAMSTITTATSAGGITMVLPTIPRATQPTVSPTSGNTGSTYTITHVPASSAFYHDIAYSLDGGGSYTNITINLVGTDTSTDWTPAHTLLPNSTSVTAIIRVITYASSGGSVIGTKTVNLPLTVPSTVIPTVSSVAWADGQTSSPDMPTLMGGSGRFVQKWSKLKPTVTAAGAGGSTITGSVVTQNGQTTPSGTAFDNPIALSGAVPYSVVATDSRTRTSDEYTNTVTVTAYNYPNLPTPLVVRTSDAGGATPSPTGTYLAVTPAASVSSLVFGAAEKNLLEWQIRTRIAAGSWTTIQAWTAATVSGNTWTTKTVLAGPYLSSVAYEVEVSIRDLFGKNAYDTANTVKTLVIPVPSETIFEDDNGQFGKGLGGYHTGTGKFLQVYGGISQDGNNVVDTTLVATTVVQGLVELTTDAEAIAGTDTDRAVTAHALAAALAVLTPPGMIQACALATAPTGWLLCDATAVSRTTYSSLFAALNPSKGTFTITIASPGVATLTAHGIQTGQMVYATTTGALPTGVSANTAYFVIRVDANTFRLATTLANALAGTAINTTGSQSGTHTIRTTYGVGDGSTTFNLPDYKGKALIGLDSSQTEFAALGQTGGAKTHVHTLTTVIAAWFQSIYKNRTSPTWTATNTQSATVGGASATTSTNGISVEGSTDSGSSLPPYGVVNYVIKT